MSKELELLFNDYVKFANYEGIATQIYFIENRRYVKPRANDTHFIVEYNRFVDKLKNSVRSKLIEEFEIKNELKMPDSIESDVLVYKLLRREELYKEFIIDFKEDELNEIPQLVYKSCYEALYNEKKHLKKEEQSEQTEHLSDTVNSDDKCSLVYLVEKNKRSVE